MIDIRKIYFTRHGIEFFYYGDTIIWIWPWRRDSKAKYYSVSFSRKFRSLKDVRRMWNYFT